MKVYHVREMVQWAPPHTQSHTHSQTHTHTYTHTHTHAHTHTHTHNLTFLHSDSGVPSGRRSERHESADLLTPTTPLHAVSIAILASVYLYHDTKSTPKIAECDQVYHGKEAVRLAPLDAAHHLNQNYYINWSC